MTFVQSLIGNDLKLLHEGCQVIRMEQCLNINSKTLIFYPHPMSQWKILGFILTINAKYLGFGKIGITSSDPYRMDIQDLNFLSLLDKCSDRDVSELPKFDMDQMDFIYDMTTGDLIDRCQEQIVYMLVIALSNSKASVFINNTFMTTLNVTNASKGGASLFFDVSGCITKIRSIHTYNVFIAEMFEDDEDLDIYCRELATYGGVLLNKNTMNVISCNCQTEYLDFLEKLDIRPDDNLCCLKQNTLKAKLDIQNGKLKAESWINNKNSNQDECEEKEPKSMDNDNGIRIREGTDLESLKGKSGTYPNPLDFFKAEFYAFNVVSTMLNSEGNKEKVINKKDFSSLFNQSQENVEVPKSDISTVRENQIPLVEKLIEFFLEYQNDFHKIQAKNMQVVKMRNYSREKCYLPTNISETVKIKVDIYYFTSITQFELMFTLGTLPTGPCLVTYSIEQLLSDTNENSMKSFSDDIQRWCLLMSQKGPSQKISQTIIMIFMYSRRNLNEISADILNYNVKIVKDMILNICFQEEFKDIFAQDPFIIDTDGVNYSTEISEIKTLLQVTLATNSSRQRCHLLFPKRWERLLGRLLAMNRQGTKLLSWGQACQVAADLGLLSVKEMTAALRCLVMSGHIKWSCSLIELGSNAASHRVLVLDNGWLLRVFTVWEAEVISAQDQKIECSSLDVLQLVMKPFSYHKPLLLSMFREAGLLVDHSFLQQPMTVLEFPDTLFSLEDSTSQHSSAPNMINSECISNSTNWYLEFTKSPPWICLISYLLRVLTICATDESNNKNRFVAFFTKSEVNVQLSDTNHQLLVKICHRNRLQVTVYKMSETKGQENLFPSPDCVGSIRLFLEQQAQLLIATVPIHRVAVLTQVMCPCNSGHNKQLTPHFLNLEKVLCSSTTFVFCGEDGARRCIPTERWRLQFPDPTLFTPLEVIKDIQNKSFGNNLNPLVMDPNTGVPLPTWLMKLSQMLNNSGNSFNWLSLSERLGYRDSEQKFSNTQNSALSLLVDWILGNGNNLLCLEFLNLTLQEAGQYEMSDVIETQLGDSDGKGEMVRPQVFISYQWHSQAEAREIATHLEQHRISTWLDVGQIGGGDLLMHRIERAVRHCKLLIACVSPRYLVSPICHRELVHADLLGKPILPVMVSRVPWPPPGGSGMLLAPYVYIDLFGVGGHGGSGRKKDYSARLNEILIQVSKYCTVAPVTLDATSPSQHQKNIKNVGQQNEISLNESGSLNRSHYSQQDFEDSGEFPRISSAITEQQSVPSYHSSSASRLSGSNQQPITTSQASVRECSSICVIL